MAEVTVDPKDPAAVLDYAVDWSEWLYEGDSISSVSWTVPTGINLDSASNTLDTATVWLSGGTAYETYTLVCQIDTAQGRRDRSPLVVEVVPVG